jgi:hypothetical protein
MFLQAPIAMTLKGEGGTFIPSVIGLKKTIANPNAEYRDCCTREIAFDFRHRDRLESTLISASERMSGRHEGGEQRCT